MLPDNFQFSQGSLQDFVDCRRRFQLRYIQRLSWPALEVEPVLENERRMRLGGQFHRLIRQHLLGVPTDRLTQIADQEIEISQWWTNYLDAKPVKSEWEIYPEVAIAGQLDNYRLVARYDLVAFQDNGAITIFDWKTNTKRPKKEWLKQKLQTRVYPYLLVQSGSQLNNGNTIDPDSLEMIYWFAEEPDQPQHFPYSQAQFEDDQAYLSALVAEIANLKEDEFPLTQQEKRCQFCKYRSLCNRGVAAGNLTEIEDELDFDAEPEVDFDFDQIAEIEY